MVSIYSDFLEKMDPIVSSYLSKHAGKSYYCEYAAKVINDPIWGCIKYTQWEISLIDTPLFQRLRDIYQVGLGIFTYPGARHSRFEHSLGTVAMASKMIEVLRDNTKHRIEITGDHITDVRMAALLHDIGHCFYSHLSEECYGKYPEFIELKRFFNKKYAVSPKAHEIFSFIIINTGSFKEYCKELEIDKAYSISDFDYDYWAERIGKMIIGAPIENHKDDPKNIYFFLTEIINGSIDADKLDYLKRDAYSAGLPLSFDIDRLLYKINVKQNKDNSYSRLVVDIAGITSVDGITFSKMMLNNYIYHHQKVLATEAIVKDIALALKELKKIEHPVDFLKFTDKDIESFKTSEIKPFTKYKSEKTLASFVDRIKHRYLPKRCFEINMRIFEIDTTSQNSCKQEAENCLNKILEVKDIDKRIDILQDYASNNYELANEKDNVADLKRFLSEFYNSSYEQYCSLIRLDLFNCINKLYENHDKDKIDDFDIFDIHVVIPKTINESITFRTPIVYGKDMKAIKENMLDYTNQWAQAFNSNKWSGYIYVNSNIDINIAFVATEKVLSTHLNNMTLNNPEYYVKRLNKEYVNELRQIM